MKWWDHGIGGWIWKAQSSLSLYLIALCGSKFLWEFFSIYWHLLQPSLLFHACEILLGQRGTEREFHKEQGGFKMKETGKKKFYGRYRSMGWVGRYSFCEGENVYLNKCNLCSLFMGPSDIIPTFWLLWTFLDIFNHPILFPFSDSS